MSGMPRTYPKSRAGGWPLPKAPRVVTQRPLMSRLTFQLRHVVLVTLSLASLFVVGCKQDLGERCEQGSDCYSGMCSQTGASAQGGTCRDEPATGVSSDAAATFDAGSDATSDGASDGRIDGRSDAGAAEVSTDGALESRVEAGSEVSSSMTEAGSEVGSEAGSEAGTTDGASGG
jgi:hypothetical protein